jgi:hypothetical protein
VNSPAITSAPANMVIMALRCAITRWWRACSTATGSVTRVKIDSKWIALHGPHIRMS